LPAFEHLVPALPAASNARHIPHDAVVTRRSVSPRHKTAARPISRRRRCLGELIPQPFDRLDQALVGELLASGVEASVTPSLYATTTSPGFGVSGCIGERRAFEQADDTSARRQAPNAGARNEQRRMVG